MPNFDDILALVEGPWGTVLLAVPWIALLIVVAVTSRVRRRPRADVRRVPAGATLDTTSGDVAPHAPLPPVPEPARVPPSPAPAEAIVTAAADTTPSQAVNGSGTIHVEAAATIDPENAALHALGEARRTLAEGKVTPAAEFLREAVRMASRAKLPAVHAAARLELAEIACIEGDLTTACEHWQIARGIFHDSRNVPERDRISERMRTHRCPTDWVLTNF